jgi:asparagine synthase (glutamine-hydrolysing)
MDESEVAATVAKKLGLRHQILECRANPADDLVWLIHHLGLPFGDSSLLPTFWLCAAAEPHVKVALSGDGGDELFAGYVRHQAAHVLGLLGVLRHFLWPLKAMFKPGADPLSPASQRARFLDAALHESYMDLVSIFQQSAARQLGIAQRAPWFAYLPRLLIECAMPVMELSSRLEVQLALASDLGSYLPSDILRKTDTASMAIPIEVRAPFLDRELAAAAVHTRVSHLMPRGKRKGLLRRIARKYLPAEIVDRPKQGFAIPIGEWFRTDYGGMKTLLLDHLNSAEPWGPPSLGIDLNKKFVRQMLDEHLGTGMSGRITRDHSQRLYMLLVLSIWAKWLGGLSRP